MVLCSRIQTLPCESRTILSTMPSHLEAEDHRPLTWVALSLGSVAGGAIVVEAVFAYPGLGTALLVAIQGFDFPVVFGIVFLVILSIAVMTLLLDLVYPLIDPRIGYGKKT